MSNAITSSGPIQSAPNRWLWAAVGALGATTLAMGVALVQMRSTPTATPVAGPAIAASAALPEAPKPVLESVAAVSPNTSAQKVPAAPVKQAHAATKNIASRNGDAKTPAPPSSPVVSAPPALADAPPVPVAAQMPPPPPRALCAHCGTVEAVTPVERDGAASGGGVVAGAVLGGLLGNQVGGGNGKTIATVLGAVGGGWAGNTVEKRMKKVTVYQIDVRMEDGSVRRVEHSSPLSVGAHVTVNGGVISQ